MHFVGANDKNASDYPQKPKQQSMNFTRKYFHLNPAEV